MENVKGDLSGWRVELSQRYGKKIAIVYKDGEVRGQIEVLDQSEEETWLRVIHEINEKGSQNSMP